MNPRRGSGGGRRIRAHVDAGGRVAVRRADDDARILRDDAAVLADDVTVAHLRRVHHALLEVEVERAQHRQLVLDHLQSAFGVCTCQNIALAKLLSLFFLVLPRENRQGAWFERKIFFSVIITFSVGPEEGIQKRIHTLAKRK